MAIPYSINNLKTWVSAICGTTEGDVCYTNVLTNTDGTRLYMVKRVVGGEFDPASFVLEEYTMTSWDVSTATLRTTKALTGLEESYGAYIKSDGTKLFFLGTYSWSNNYLFCYTFSTPWDTDTLSFTTVADSTLLDESPYAGLCFSEDGLYFYATFKKNSSTKYVYQKALSVAWNIASTITTHYTAEVADTYEESPLWVQVSNDGLRIFFLHASGIIYKCDLATAWDIETAGAATLELDTTFLDARWFYYNTTESKLYVLGFDGSIFVVEYNSTGLSLFWTNFHGQSEVSV